MAGELREARAVSALWYTPDITITHEQYEKLLEAQKQAEQVIAARQREEEEVRDLYRHHLGKAIFYTKDGMEAVRMVPDEIKINPIIKFACRTEHRLRDMTESFSVDAIEVRTYQRTGDMKLGMPVYQEL